MTKQGSTAQAVGPWDYALGRYVNEPACGEPRDGTNVRCTKAKGHSGKHVAASSWSVW